MIDRTQAPQIKDLTSVYLPPSELYTLPNGVIVCEINTGSQDILRMDIVHKAGRITENNRIAARATAVLLKDGCGQKSSDEFSEWIDFYGAGIKTGSNMDFSYSTLYTLTKHADALLPLLHEMYTEPTFDEVEVQKFKMQNIQKLREELTKNDVLTFRHFTEEVFGVDHPYGYNSTEEDYIRLDRSHLISHFNEFYGSDNCYIFLSGRINDNVRKWTHDLFGTTIKKSASVGYTPATSALTPKSVHLKSKNKHQAALKMGCRLFDRTHPDNAGFFVLNTILGGYFGSRLMTNIREDKGYTYDICSITDQMLYDGCFYVDTEADPQYMASVMQEIYKEMDILQNQKVSPKELKMVKNYLMGNFMNMADGPVNMASLAKTMVLTGKKTDDFQDFVAQVLDVTSEDIMSLARKYFNPQNFIDVIVMPEQMSLQRD